MTKAKPFNYGGQAIIEGVMMRGSRTMAAAVRNPQGQIVIHHGPLNQRVYGSAISRIPFVRGFVMLYDALGLGMHALMYSANIAAAEETDAPDGVPGGGQAPSDVFDGPLGWGTVVFSLVLGLGLFFFLPAAIAAWLDGLLGIGSALISNLVEGVIRLVILIGYMALIGQMQDVRRMFQYHGAEHKTINAYEAGADMTPASVRQFPLAHPRCGTAFLLTVAVVSVLLFAPLPRDPLWLRFLSRIVLIPVVAGVGYEILRFTAGHLNNPLIRALIAPNLALQRLTTREPDESMLEVAIAALQRVLADEFAEAGAPAAADAQDAALQSPSLTS